MNFKDFKKSISGNTEYLEFCKKNSKEESLLMGITHCKDCELSNSLPKLWYKNGYTDKIFTTYLIVTTYVETKDKKCSCKYNPTVKTEERKDFNGKVYASHNVLNFDWLLEDNEQNIQLLINEVAKRFYE